MFSLILTIVSIALVAALALATLYYGSTAFNKGSEQAQASKIINSGAQIQGAATLRAAETADDKDKELDTLTTLVSEKYLAAIPEGDWTVVNGGVVRLGLEQKVCEALNAKLGITGTPQCSDLTVAEGCCTIDN